MHQRYPSRLGLLAFILPFLAACGNDRSPAEFLGAEAKGATEIEFKYNPRSSDGIVEDLFDAIKDERADVAALCEEHEQALETTDERIGELNKEDERIAHYFGDARRHLESIEDSTMRTALAAGITAAEQDWKARHTARDRMVERLQDGRAQLVDEMERMKLKLTLDYVHRLMEKDVHDLQPGKAAFAQQADIRSRMRKLAP